MTTPPDTMRASELQALLEEYGPQNSLSENLIDILFDAMHWCLLNGESFDNLLSTARSHLELPWDAEEQATLHDATRRPWAVWKLAPESDREERHIITTADGEQEVTSLIHRQVDAQHIVRCVNLHGRLIEALAECVRLLADYDETDGDEGRVFRSAARILWLAEKV